MGKKKGSFWVKNSVSWARSALLHGIYILHKNDAFVAKIVNTRLTKIFITIFAPDERLPSSATLLETDYHPPLSQSLTNKCFGNLTNVTPAVKDAIRVVSSQFACFILPSLFQAVPLAIVLRSLE